VSLFYISIDGTTSLFLINLRSLQGLKSGKIIVLYWESFTEPLFELHHNVFAFVLSESECLRNRRPTHFEKSQEQE
jgi:hypothetical protein